MNFPHGVPVVDDAYMAPWMAYVYEQQTMPQNATGVIVSIDVIDANGNFRNIGTATTDLTGKFSFMWTPDIAGKYTLIASYGGSNSYWGSSSKTAFGVIELHQRRLRLRLYLISYLLRCTMQS